MMYQCGRCGLTRASSQEPIGLVTPQCKCPWEFVPPVAPQRQWVGLMDEEKQEWIDAMPYDPQPRHCMTLVNIIEAKLKEKNT